MIEIWAGVVPDETLDLEQIKRHFEQKVGRALAVDKIVAVDSVPRTSVGKIKRVELRDKLMALQKLSMMQ
jgi:acyl-coenzyme A synthetase/AMP-(fatty) acid ligase